MMRANISNGNEQTISTQTQILPALMLDRTAFAVVSSFETSDDDRYWWSRTPQERLHQIELLRRINYGPHAAGRLQRVLEITQRTSG